MTQAKKEKWNLQIPSAYGETLRLNLSSAYFDYPENEESATRRESETEFRTREGTVPL